MLKIAIIGTAGRQEDGHKLTTSDFDRMYNLVESLVLELTDDPYIVSGGAAWADHIAVELYRRHSFPLKLHLPCEFDFSRDQYVDNGIFDYKVNPGGTSNHYHKAFALKTGIPSLQQLSDVLKLIQYTVGKGFHNRNSQVADVDVVIAVTFGSGAQLKDGGTADTLGKYLKNTSKNLSYHLDLNQWKIYTPAII